MIGCVYPNPCIRIFGVVILKAEVSVHRCQSESRREFWVELKGIALLLCSAKGNITVLCAEKLCIPSWKGLVRNFIAAAQRYGC